LDQAGLVLVVLICPKALGVFLDVAGLPNCGWLNRLKKLGAELQRPDFGELRGLDEGCVPVELAGHKQNA